MTWKRWLLAGAMALAVACGGQTAQAQPPQRFHVLYSQDIDNYVGQLEVVCDTSQHHLLYMTDHGVAAPAYGSC